MNIFEFVSVFDNSGDHSRQRRHPNLLPPARFATMSQLKSHIPVKSYMLWGKLSKFLCVLNFRNFHNSITVQEQTSVSNMKAQNTPPIFALAHVCKLKVTQNL